MGCTSFTRSSPLGVSGTEHDVGDDGVEGPPFEGATRFVHRFDPGAGDRQVLEARAQHFSRDLIVLDEKHLALGRAAGSLRPVAVVSGFQVPCLGARSCAVRAEWNARGRWLRRTIPFAAQRLRVLRCVRRSHRSHGRFIPFGPFGLRSGPFSTGVAA